MTMVTLKLEGDLLQISLPVDAGSDLGLHAGDRLSMVPIEGGVKLVSATAEQQRQRAGMMRVLETHAETFRELAGR